MNKITTKIGGYYQVKIIRADGTERVYPKQKNMILNGGLDELYLPPTSNSAWVARNVTAMTTGFIGTGSAAVVATNTSLSVSYKTSIGYITSAGSCGSTINTATGTNTHKRTFTFTPESGSVTIREIGVGGSNLWSRIVLASPVNLVVGDTFTFSYSQIMIIDQIVNPSTVNLTSGSFALVGQIAIRQTYAYIFGQINSDGSAPSQGSYNNGNTWGGGVLFSGLCYDANNFQGLKIMASSEATFLPQNTTAVQPSILFSGPQNHNRWHTAGTTTYGNTVTFPSGTPSTTFSNIRSFGITLSGPSGTSFYQPIIQILLDAPQTKTPTTTFTLGFTTTITRL